jgi:hypothetical protein
VVIRFTNRKGTDHDHHRRRTSDRRSAPQHAQTPSPARSRGQPHRLPARRSRSRCPASAASYVTGCFKFASPYNGAYSNDHASLSLYSNGSWVAVASTTTDYNGCAAFNISGSWRNYPAKLTAMRRVGPAIFTGQTPLYAFGGNQRSDLGTGIVYCYGCV